MIIIPAIDILGGKAVRLTKGDFKTAKVYSADPLAVAKEFIRKGSEMLHIVDLDAARIGKPVNKKLIIKIAKIVNIPIQVGGGIRSQEMAREYLHSGVDRVVIGTQALVEPKIIESLIKEFGSNRILVAVEIKNSGVAINGWQKVVKKNYLGFAKELKALGVTEILFTDISKDGTMTEPNLKATKKLADLGFAVTASGGVTTIESIRKLKANGACRVILGKALYEGKISLTKVKKTYKCNLFSLFKTEPISGLTKRIIPCLDVKDGKVVKGVRFKDHKVMGDIVELAKRYRNEGADEIVFYDITASIEGRTASLDWVKRVAEVIDIPFCVAGGIRTVDEARRILQSGADKISINSPALENPNLINQLAAEFGSQCVVVGIDSFEKDGEYFVKQYTGNPTKTRSTSWRTFDWALEAQKRGAGEVVLNCMNQDGVKRGYDLRQLKQLRSLLTIPLIASGGAGSQGDFLNVFQDADVEGALAASVFHSGDIRIPDLKSYLKSKGIKVRI